MQRRLTRARLRHQGQWTVRPADPRRHLALAGGSRLSQHRLPQRAAAPGAAGGVRPHLHAPALAADDKSDEKRSPRRRGGARHHHGHWWPRCTDRRRGGWTVWAAMIRELYASIGTKVTASVRHNGLRDRQDRAHKNKHTSGAAPRVHAPEYVTISAVLPERRSTSSMTRHRPGLKDRARASTAVSTVCLPSLCIEISCQRQRPGPAGSGMG